MGLTCQLWEEGILGVILFTGGILLPVLLFGILYYFRMMGAGDIKLLCVAGGFLGPIGGFSCIVRSLLIAAVFSLTIMCRHHIFGKRMSYLWTYINECSEGVKWRSYMDGTDEQAKFCFSIPVLMGILSIIVL